LLGDPNSRSGGRAVVACVALALGAGAALGVAACGEDRGTVEIEGGTTGTGTVATGTVETVETVETAP
jgi:hypothetical protein